MEPEHEFSLVDEELKPLPTTDKAIKDFHGRIVNFVEQAEFTFGKELQSHVMELKAKDPFTSPQHFEETMQVGVNVLSDFLDKYDASLLRTDIAR